MFSKIWCSSIARALAVVALLAGTPVAAADDRPAPLGGDFTLDSAQGPFNLSDLRGKVVMLFFGYTSCPDICPLSLARIAASLSSLDAEQAQRVGALFITLDPARDDVERMDRYAGFFHPGIIGLTGGAGEIDEVTGQYGIAYERTPAPGSALGYSISHPDTVLLVDADGVLVDRVGSEEEPETLRAKVLELLARRG